MVDPARLELDSRVYETPASILKASASVSPLLNCQITYISIITMFRLL